MTEDQYHRPETKNVCSQNFSVQHPCRILSLYIVLCF